MKNKAFSTVIGCLLYLISTSLSHANVVLSMIPDAQSVSAGSSVSFAIDISGLGSGTALGAYDLSINFDPALLSYTQTNFGDTLLGDQLDLAGTGLNSPLATPSPSSVNLIEFSFDDPTTLVAQQAGNFTLATLYFNALTDGQASVALSINSLSDAGSNNIPATVVPVPGGLLLFMSGLFLFYNQQKKRI